MLGPRGQSLRRRWPPMRPFCHHEPMTATLALLLLLILGSPQGPPAPPAAPGEPNPEMMSVAEGSGPRGLLRNDPEAFDGVTLFSPLNSNDTYLIDMDGEVLHQWRTDSMT